jgi:hypothetical protein
VTLAEAGPPPPVRKPVSRARAGSLWIALAFGGGAHAGCLDDEMDPNGTGSSGDTFIAVQADFASFRSWTRIEVAPAGAPAVDGGHPAGPRAAYLNRTPTGGSFPVGTLIVKTAEIGDPTTWNIHARAKRGGNFNLQGAIDWEWFELKVSLDNEAVLIWRGEKSPTNHGYESLPGLGSTSSTDGDCNGCHAAARDTDFILAPALTAMLLLDPP